jgi:hypothetical protein
LLVSFDSPSHPPGLAVLGEAYLPISMNRKEYYAKFDFEVMVALH